MAVAVARQLEVQPWPRQSSVGRARVGEHAVVPSERRGWPPIWPWSTTGWISQGPGRMRRWPRLPRSARLPGAHICGAVV
eukprot:3031207-Pyramimonas_sp.AAC.1